MNDYLIIQIRYIEYDYLFEGSQSRYHNHHLVNNLSLSGKSHNLVNDQILTTATTLYSLSLLTLSTMYQRAPERTSGDL